MMDKAEQPTTQAQYLAVRCDNMPTDCVNFGVVDTLLGKEICRVWEEEDCRMIADLLNAPPIPDRTTSLAAQDGLVEALRDALAAAYVAGATDVHNAWVEGVNGGEPDFDEAGGDYAHSIDLSPPKEQPHD